MASKIPAEGMVCTPAKQTESMMNFASLSEEKLKKLLSNNLATREGRKNFVRLYNKLMLGTDAFEWTAEDESDDDTDDSGFKTFWKYKIRFDTVNRVFISMVEGNHRLLCIFYSFALRKVHKSARLTAGPPKDDEGLTKEYLLKRGADVNASILTKEGNTLVKEGVSRVFHHAEQLEVSLTLKIPTSENSKKCPIGDCFIEPLRKISKEYSASKQKSSKPSDFAFVAELLYDGYSRLRDGTLKKRVSADWKMGKTFSIGDTVVETKKVNMVNIDTVSKNRLANALLGNETRENWSRSIRDGLSNIGDGRLKVTMVKDNGKKKKKKGSNKSEEEEEYYTMEYPLRSETYQLLKNGTTNSTDVSELNLIVLSNHIVPYAFKKQGGDSEIVIDRAMMTLLNSNTLNSSGERKNIKDIGEDANKGLAAAMMILTMYEVGSIYNDQNDVVRLFEEMARGTLNNKSHWNCWSEYDIHTFLFLHHQINKKIILTELFAYFIPSEQDCCMGI